MNSISGLVTQATPIADRLLTWFAETTLVASAFAVLALLVTRIRWLSPGPAARHAFWLLILLKLVTPPLVHWPWSVASPWVVASAETVEIDVPSIRSIEVEEKPEIVSTVVYDSPLSPIDAPEAWDWSGWTVWLASAWVIGSVVRALFQGVRLARFNQSLSGSELAPEWLVDEAESVGRRLGVRVPPIRVVSRLATPLVWCLARPVLLVPAGLLKTLEADRWRAILTHELAHLRRGDHWVRRLELAASLAWWWCPLFWWVCRKLEFEAELASDAWAIWESPGERVNYAESLIRIGTKLSLVEPPTPALGVVGSGRSFERRLTMILKNPIERQISMPSLFLAASLAALALPSWTLAAQAPDEPAKVAPTAPKVQFMVTRDPVIEVLIIDDEEDDDDDEKETPDKKSKKKVDVTVKKLEKKQKAMELEIQAKFAKKLEAMVKDMELKLGDGSDFAKQMEAFAKEMEAKFGPDSEFVKQLTKEVTSKKPMVKVETQMRVFKDKEEAEKFLEKMKPTEKVQVKVTAPDKPGSKATRTKQAKRIEALQSAIDQLQKELKALKAESEDDDQD
jgi:beta-lactamase regulating signal transducer with metallopeptidase domain